MLSAPEPVPEPVPPGASPVGRLLLAMLVFAALYTLLLRASLLPRLIERGLLLVRDHRALWARDTVAPLAASALAALLVPQRLMRALVGGPGGR